MRPTAPAAALAALLAAIQPAAAAGTAEGSSSPEELAEAFFSSPRLSRIRISPSGSHIAALYAADGEEMIVVRALDGGNPVPLVGLPDPEARFRWLQWANDDRILFSVEELAPRRQPPKSIRTRLYGIDRDGSNHFHMARNWSKLILVGRGDFQFEDQIVDLLEDDPGHVLISIRKPTEIYPAVYELDVDTGGLERVVELFEGVNSWFADHHGVVRAGMGYQHEEWRLVGRTSGDGEFRELAEFEYFEDGAFYFEGFSFDPEKLYVSIWEDGFTTLHEYDLVAGELGERLLAVPGFDVPRWLEFSDERRQLTAAGYLGERRERHFFDDEARKRQAALDHALPGTFNEIVSETRDRKTAIVEARGDTTPPAYYLYRPEAKQLELLFSTLPAVAGLELAPTRPVSYEARDGRTIPAYLTVPAGDGGDPPPLVVIPHGGPSARDVWDWDPSVQYLARLGFAVLQPNFRGSTGYGLEYWTAGMQEWGLAMQDDVTDGVEWLIESGTVDPRRICIFGSSYGGYAALMGLVQTPELYRCAASYAGPMDLVMMLNHDKGYLFSEINTPFVGGTVKDRERLRRTSPIENLERIRAPVLLGHGEDDERVHVAHSQKMAKALEKAGKEVELLVLEDESHAFRAEEGRIEFFAALGRFLLEHTRPLPAADEAAETAAGAAPAGDEP